LRKPLAPRRCTGAPAQVRRSNAGSAPELCVVAVPQSPPKKRDVQREQAMGSSRGILRHPVHQVQQFVAEVAHLARFQCRQHSTYVPLPSSLSNLCAGRLREPHHHAQPRVAPISERPSHRREGQGAKNDRRNEPHAQRGETADQRNSYQPFSQRHAPHTQVISQLENCTSGGRQPRLNRARLLRVAPRHKMTAKVEPYQGKRGRQGPQLRVRQVARLTGL
jgi:hypothetical protein